MNPRTTVAEVASGTAEYEMFCMDPVFGRCRSRILDTLFSNGLQVKGATPEFSEFVRQRYEPFLLQAFDQMVCFGFVTYTFIREEKQRFPAIVHHHLRSVRIETHDDFTVRWQVFTRRSFQTMRPDPAVHVWPVPGEHPDILSGRLRSRVTRTVHNSRWVDQMMRMAVLAEFHNTRPFMVVEDIPGKGEASAIIDAQTTQLSIGPDSAAREQNAVARLENSQERLETGEELSATGPYVPGAGPSKFTEAYGRVFMVPPGRRSVNSHAEARSRADLLDFERERQEHIAGVMGLPANLVLSGRRKGMNTVAVAVQSDLDMFRDTCHRFREWMLHLLRIIHLQLFGSVDEELQFTIPFTPITASVEELERMAASGVISEEVFREAWLLRVGLDPSTPAGKVVRPIVLQELDIKKKQAEKKPASNGGH